MLFYERRDNKSHSRQLGSRRGRLHVDLVINFPNRLIDAALSRCRRRRRDVEPLTELRVMVHGDAPWEAIQHDNTRDCGALENGQRKSTSDTSLRV